MAHSILSTPFPVQPTVVIDWEGSGPIIGNMCGDGTRNGHRALGFGIVAGYIEPMTCRPVLCARMSVGILPRDVLTIPENTDGFRRMWEDHHWDMDTFGFWSGRTPGSEHHLLTGHLPMLAALLRNPEPGSDFADSHSAVYGYADAAKLLDGFLRSVEAKSPTGAYTMVTDACGYDPALSFGLLAQNGYLPMTHLRNGDYRYHGTYDEESLLLDKPLQTNADAKLLDLDKRAASLLPSFLRVDHHPQADAAKILMRFLLASA